MTSLTEEFLASGATAYPCGNKVQATELLSQVPGFQDVKIASDTATKLRSWLGKGVAASKRCEVRRTK